MGKLRIPPCHASLGASLHTRFACVQDAAQAGWTWQFGEGEGRPKEESTTMDTKMQSSAAATAVSLDQWALLLTLECLMHARSLVGVRLRQQNCLIHVSGANAIYM